MWGREGLNLRPQRPEHCAIANSDHAPPYLGVIYLCLFMNAKAAWLYGFLLRRAYAALCLSERCGKSCTYILVQFRLCFRATR